MSRKKNEPVWVGGKEATAILSKNAGRPIIDAYLRLLARTGKITYRPVDGRTNEYLKSDVEGYTVARRSKKDEVKV